MRNLFSLLILVVLMFVLSAICPAADIYVTQNTSGSNTGADCADARSASWFNANQTGGNVYHLCGTFTGNAGTNMLTVSGGSSGNTETVLFESGAVMTAPNWGTNSSYYPTGGAIQINGSYVLIDGGSNGVIQNTLSGSPGTACPGGSCTFNGATAGVYVSASSSHVEIKNLTIKNIYLCNGAAKCENAGGATSASIMVGTSYAGSNLSIHDNSLGDAGMGVFTEFSGGAISNVNIYNNTITGPFWGVAIGSGSSGNSTSNVNVNGNTISGCKAWQGDYNEGGAGNGPHCDGVMVYCTRGATCPFNIYNNSISESGAVTADVYCTYGTGSSGSGSQCTIFNNVLYIDNYSGAGVGGGTAFWAGGGTGPHYLYNNTIVGSTTGPSNYVIMLGEGTVQDLKNNLFTTDHFALYNYSGSFPTYLKTADYNLYYNLNSSPFYSSGDITITQWKGLGFDAHAVTSNPNLDANYKLQSGSAAIGAATNLTSLGITALNSDKAGTSRPSSGAWDVGAYQYSSQGNVAPPTNLAATVH